jgi:hypothetical protein
MHGQNKVLLACTHERLWLLYLHLFLFLTMQKCCIHIKPFTSKSIVEFMPRTKGIEHILTNGENISSQSIHFHYNSLSKPVCIFVLDVGYFNNSSLCTSACY